MVCSMLTINRQRSSASNACRLTSSALSWGAWLVSRLWCWGWQFSYRPCKLLQYTHRVGNLPRVAYFVIVIVWSQAMPVGVGVAKLGIKLGNVFFLGSLALREGLNGKKNFSFGHCPNHLTLPPPWPQFGQLGPFFSEVKIQDLKVSLELRILYVLYNIHIARMKTFIFHWCLP